MHNSLAGIITILTFAAFCGISADSVPSVPTIILNSTNHVAISGTINGPSIAKAIVKLTKIDLSFETELYVFIASHGGSVSAGNNLIEQMRFLKSQNHTIVCIVDHAYSMGFVILQYCDTRLITPTSSVMQHQMSLPKGSGGVWGSFENMKSYMDYLDQVSAQMDNDQAARLNMSLHDFKNKIAHDWWLHGDNIIENGVADGYAHVGCDTNLTSGTHTETFHIFIFTIVVTFSNCPTIISPLEITMNANNKTALESKYESYHIKATEMVNRLINPKMNQPLVDY